MLPLAPNGLTNVREVDVTPLTQYTYHCTQALPWTRTLHTGYAGQDEIHLTAQASHVVTR
ncbi:hypothetical protein K443DRAFT_412972 [Laccaria amethystina LaAM-08-1]|uniref:Unplaced genomic scaffold K443scaffold_330, whole genome shotgun sequence n=1 Tax=Laccaria amethystina LaAM-08-1 TaxID=1095629 RepID=A0A0C9X640_9AGAR|nr:hypothetical protein K443DRAFT_412972 [Laccaria amethystina LaAM-08-1]